MPGVAFNCLLDQSVQVGFAAMPAKGGGIGEDARPAPLIAFVAAPLYHPAHQGGSISHSVSPGQHARRAGSCASLNGRDAV